MPTTSRAKLGNFGWCSATPSSAVAAQPNAQKSASEAMYGRFVPSWHGPLVRVTPAGRRTRS
eukprot:1470724-Alexandrium_andersonii.AAC.1